MKVHIITLFPKSFPPYLDMSIMKRAQEKGLFRYIIYNLADWTVRNTRRVDDRPYGWLPGTVIMVEPLYNCINSIFESSKNRDIPIIYFSPRGKKLTQARAEWFANKHKECILICGHYEWIDERIFNFFSITSLSIGDYVLSSGELWALVWIDSVVRLLPWVLNEESLLEESFSKAIGRKKEYPQYTRPDLFQWQSVPSVLLSWDKKRIEQWKKSFY